MTRSILLGSVAAIALCGVAEAGELRGTYFAFEAGVNWVGGERFFEDWIYDTSNFTYSEYRLEFEKGWALFGSVGYAFDNNWRLEAEFGYRRNKFDNLFGSSSSVLPPGGHLNEWSIMANVLYDFYLTKRLSLSVGAGIGADNADFKVNFIGFDDNDWNFAWQGLAGLNYQIGDQTQLFLNYRYLHVDAPDWSNRFDLPDPGTHRVVFLGDLEKHTVTLGLRLFLEGEEEAPPPPPVVPPKEPPPPPPVEEPKQFIVFFGFNKFNLTAEAQRVVEEAAAAVKEFGAAAVSIVGHTDSSGSASYNQALSERRAHAVRIALESLGIPPENIHTSAKGESELLVDTGDGVKEPQNRRATIDLE